VDSKIEGAHAEDWALDGVAMAPDLFIDGRVFEPGKAADYAASFAIGRLPA
jgi:hypothetical protein